MCQTMIYFFIFNRMYLIVTYLTSHNMCEKRNYFLIYCVCHKSTLEVGGDGRYRSVAVGMKTQTGARWTVEIQRAPPPPTLYKRPHKVHVTFLVRSASVHWRSLTVLLCICRSFVDLALGGGKKCWATPCAHELNRHGTTWRNEMK